MANWASNGGGSSGGGSSSSWVTKTSNYTASAGDNIFADTSGGAFTITLPASPSVNDTVQVADVAQIFDANPLTIDPNGGKIFGVAQNMPLSRLGQCAIFTYTGAIKGWAISGGVAPYDGAQWNLLDAYSLSIYTDLNGRRATVAPGSNSAWISLRADAKSARNSGKLYFEFKIIESSIFNPVIGVGTSTASLGTYVGGDANGWGMTLGPSGATMYNNGSFTSQTAYAAGDICGIAVDFTAGNGTIKFYKNNVANGQFTGLTLGTLYPMFSGNAGVSTKTSGTLNTRSTQCTYSPPSGYSYWDS